jgi:Flp pilus assembly protein TadD
VDTVNRFRILAKLNRGDFNGSINEFNKAIAINPDNPVAYYNRGVAKINFKDFKERSELLASLHF